mgnify:CR=1 FL=1
MEKHDFNLTYAQPSRQQRLLAWIRENGVSLSSIARTIGVSVTIVSKWIRAESIPTRRVAQLKDYGIPEDLLPPGVDLVPGPKLEWKEPPAPKMEFSR